MPTPTRQTGPSIEEEVLANIRGQAVGPHTVGDYGLPEPFLRRLADRIIRASFIERHRRVIGEWKPRIEGPGQVSKQDESVRIVRQQWPPGVAEYRRSLPEGRPELRGCRAPILEASGVPWPWRYPKGDPDLEPAARLIAARLTSDGLLGAVIRAIDLLGPGRLMAEPDGGGGLLRRVGVPTDLLVHFRLPGGQSGADIPLAVARAIQAEGLGGGLTCITGAEFHWQPTRPGFRLNPSGGPAALVRLHLTGGEYWGGRGAGGSLDVARQLVEHLPHARFIAAAEERHIDQIRAAVREWPLSPGQLTLLPMPFPVSQWAQDNAVTGTVGEAGGAFTLLPRYASRGEDGSILIPGETFAGEALAWAGLATAQSPLLFQGGNVAAARTGVGAAGDGERILLIGEAEIHRNTVLGLSPSQVEEAFRSEFGADRTVILPAVSFHIDFDVLPWATASGMLAFVNDPMAAVREVMLTGVPALVAAGALDARSGRTCGEHLEAGRLGAAGPMLAEALFGIYQDGFPSSLAPHFAAGEVDAGPANLQRFALALDMLMSEIADPARQRDGHFRAYLESFRRSARDRRVLHQILKARGFEVATVPSISEANLSLNYLNGVRDGDRYLLPAYSGHYADLDGAAAAAFLKRLPPGSEVIPIRCGETQRRSGAVHCAASVIPA